MRRLLMAKVLLFSILFPKDFFERLAIQSQTKKQTVEQIR
jgi:hypothetical protein